MKEQFERFANSLETSVQVNDGLTQTEPVQVQLSMIKKMASYLCPICPVS